MSPQLQFSAVFVSFRKTRLSISKNTQHGRWGQGPGSVDPRFPAGLPFPVPEILEFVACRDSGKFFQQFSRSFPGTFLQNSCTDPGNSHSLLEFSESFCPFSDPYTHKKKTIFIAVWIVSTHSGQQKKRLFAVFRRFNLISDKIHYFRWILEPSGVIPPNHRFLYDFMDWKRTNVAKWHLASVHCVKILYFAA